MHSIIHTQKFVHEESKLIRYPWHKLIQMKGMVIL
jgi:hypothetical protein